MMNRLQIVGIVVALGGVGLAGAAFGYGLPQATDGLQSAQDMYEAQGITLSYNEQGQLVDRGTVEGAQATLALLEGEWGFPVNHANLDPNDPLVNTRDELMYQYATITKHVLHREVDVTLTDEDVPITYRGVVYTEAGVYPIEVGKYFAELDRSNPIEAQLRGAWDPLALSLLGTLAAAHANQATGELAAGVSWGIGGIGALFALSGVGLVWAAHGQERTHDHVVARKGLGTTPRMVVDRRTSP